MKDQYFGNERDYFKYDLMLDLMCCLGISRFTNIVMLTPNDRSGHGEQTDYGPGNRRRTLYDFLQMVAKGPKQDRRVVRLQEYFERNYPDIEYIPYRDEDDSTRQGSYLTECTRDSYFKGIQASNLQRAVILVDPDIGLCPPYGFRKKDKSAWVLPDELLELKEAMGRSSALVMTQFQRGMSRDRRFDYIKEKVGSFDAIYGQGLIFACFTKDPAVRSKLQECLCKYKGKDQSLKVHFT